MPRTEEAGRSGGGDSDPGVVEHVMMTADAVGGVWTYALDLARALGDRHIRVSIVALGPSPSASQRAEAIALPGVALYERPGALEWMDEPWADVDDTGEWLLALERELRPDVVHLNGYCHAALDWRAPILVAAHSCVLSWWRAVHGSDAPPAWSEYARRVAAGLRAADAIVAPTHAMLTSLEEHYSPLLGGSLGVTRVIPNGRDARLLNGSREKELFVLTAGRLWDQAKNVEAVASIARDLPWPVWFAGDPRHPSGHTADWPNVRCLGRLEPRQLAAWMERAAIYALPVRYEPFGLSILEAGLAGCTLVVGDIPSQREIWGDAAVYVAPEDRPALAAAIHRLARDPAERQRRGEAAAARARELTASHMADSYRDAYATLTRGSLRLSA